jgi:hypothetical protein
MSLAFIGMRETHHLLVRLSLKVPLAREIKIFLHQARAQMLAAQGRNQRRHPGAPKTAKRANQRV